MTKLDAAPSRYEVIVAISKRVAKFFRDSAKLACRGSQVRFHPYRTILGRTASRSLPSVAKSPAFAQSAGQYTRGPPPPS
jgi:hypothetical protein